MLGKHTLKPGETTKLKAVFKTKDAPGPFEKIITIETDAEGQKQIELVMTGTVKEAPGPKISISPRRIDLGVFKAGEKKSPKLSIKNPGELPLTITAVNTRKGSGVIVNAGSIPLTIAAGQTADVELAITTGTPGAFNERLFIESNAKNAPKTGFIILVIGQTQ